MDGKFSPEINLIEVVSKEFNKLKQIAKKYPLIHINFENLENQINKEINEQLKIPLPIEKVYIPIRKPKTGLTQEEKEKKELEKELDNKNVLDLQIRKFKNEFKNWLHNLIITLNRIKLKNKELNVKKIINPLTKLEYTKTASKIDKEKIIKKVLAKLSVLED